MAHFVADTDTKEIHADWWDEGETVTIKRYSFVDDQTIDGRASTVIRDENGKATAVQVDMGKWTSANLEIGIVSWTLRNGSGEVVPCTTENKRRLNKDDGDFILDALVELNKARSDADQLNFRG